MTGLIDEAGAFEEEVGGGAVDLVLGVDHHVAELELALAAGEELVDELDRKSTRLNSSHLRISYAVFCLDRKSVV